MGTVHNSYPVKVYIIRLFVLAALLSIRATTVLGQGEVAECGNFGLDTGIWIERDIMPVQCGVPVTAKDIEMHVGVTNVTYGMPELHTAVRFRGPVYLGHECVTDAFVGATCSTMQQDESDPEYADTCYFGDVCTSSYRDEFRIWLGEEDGGAINFDVWFTYQPYLMFDPIYTPSPTATGTPPTATATPTGTPPTPTATSRSVAPTATRPNFNDPNFGGGVPTAISTVDFSNLSRMSTPPPAPQSTPYPTLVSVQPSFVLSYSSPSALTYTTQSTNSAQYQSELILSQAQSTISDVIAVATTLSDTVHALMVATDTITISTVPDWYAPHLPRPVAQIGWDFEGMGSDVRRRYSLSSWTTWTAELLAVPVQFIKGLIPWAQALGPLGLVLAWLLVMLPIKLLLDMLDFLKNLAVQVFNFLLKIVHILIDLIDIFIPF